MKKVLIDYPLFVKIYGYFALIEEPTAKERAILEALDKKAQALANHQEWTQRLMESKETAP